MALYAIVTTAPMNDSSGNAIAVGTTTNIIQWDGTQPYTPQANTQVQLYSGAAYTPKNTTTPVVAPTPKIGVIAV